MMANAGKEEVVWLELPQESCDVSVRILPYDHHDDVDDDREKEAVVILHAPSHLLIKIPYFATSLNPPWQASKESSRRQITLQCTSAATRPSDFRLCLQFLKPEENDFKWQLNAVLNLLPPADYLHFQECTDLCMQYLAMMKWSDADEVAVHQAFADTGIKPSADVYARLAPLPNAKDFFKEALLVHAEYACTAIMQGGWNVEVTKQYQCFADFLKDAASKALPQMSQLALTEVWMSMTDGIIKRETLTESRMKMWSVVTSVILEQGDKGAIIKAWIERFQQFCNAVSRASTYHQPKEVRDYFERSMTRLLWGVIPSREKPIVMLSNAERASLCFALIPMLNNFHSVLRWLETAFEDIVCTLPLQDPIMRKLMKEYPSKFYLSDNNDMQRFWRSKLFLALNRSNMKGADTSPTTLP